MKNKLTLNETIENFLETEEKQIWHSIINNQLEALNAELEGKDTLLHTILSELFTTGESDTLKSYDFAIIKDGNSILLKDMVRLTFTLDINGEYEEKRIHIVDKIFESIPEIVTKIKEEANGYPRKPMNGLAWAEGAGMRSAINALIYYYNERGNSDDSLHFLIMNRTQITLSIMGHYKHLVGPDMLEAAKIKEKLGQEDVALNFYNGVKGDFMSELGWFQESPEHGPNEEDIVTLQSLKEALLSIDRLSNTTDYTDTCGVIDEILTREYVEYDFDEEDDDED